MIMISQDILAQTNCENLKKKEESYGYSPDWGGWCDMDSPTPYTECMCEASEYRELQKRTSLMNEVNADVKRAKNLEREYYDLLTKAWDTEDEQYARQAITKIKEARKYVDDAYKKYKAYHNPDEIYRSTPKEWTYTNMLSRYDDYIADAQNTIDNCCPQEENVIKLTGPQVVDVPEDYDPETASEENFWVYGNNTASGMLEIDGRKVNLANYKFYTYLLASSSCGWTIGRENRVVSTEFSSYISFAPLNTSDEQNLNYIFLELGDIYNKSSELKEKEHDGSTYYSYESYLNSSLINPDKPSDWKVIRTSDITSISTLVDEIIPCNYDFMSGKRSLNTNSKIADYEIDGFSPNNISVLDNENYQDPLYYFIKKFRPNLTVESQLVVNENKAIQKILRNGVINNDYLENDFIQMALRTITKVDPQTWIHTPDKDKQIKALAYIIQYFIYLENEYQNRK